MKAKRKVGFVPLSSHGFIPSSTAHLRSVPTNHALIQAASGFFSGLGWAVAARVSQHKAKISARHILYGDLDEALADYTEMLVL